MKSSRSNIQVFAEGNRPSIKTFENIPSIQSDFGDLHSPEYTAIKDAETLKSILGIEHSLMVEKKCDYPTTVLLPIYFKPHQVSIQVDAISLYCDKVQSPLDVLFVEGADNSAGNMYQNYLQKNSLKDCLIIRESSVMENLSSHYRTAADTSGELDFLDEYRNFYKGKTCSTSSSALIIGVAPHIPGIRQLLNGKVFNYATALSAEGILYALHPELLEKYVYTDEYRETEEEFRRGELLKNVLRRTIDKDGKILRELARSPLKTKLHKLVHGY